MTTHARGTVGTGKRPKLTFSMAKGALPSSRKTPVGMRGRKSEGGGREIDEGKMKRSCRGREDFDLNPQNGECSELRGSES
jgi:hypothetical protein